MPEHPPSAAGEFTGVRLAAMDLLARREHSRRELRQKLRRRFRDRNLIDTVVEGLVQERLQSDSRYAQSYLRQRAERGYGPLRIRQEMRQRGIGDDDIGAAFAAGDQDWLALAARAMTRKFGDSPCADLRERARRARFLQYRGFSTEHCSALLG